MASTRQGTVAPVADRRIRAVVATRLSSSDSSASGFSIAVLDVGVDTADVAAGEVRLEGSDGAELVELLGFVRDWLGGPD